MKNINISSIKNGFIPVSEVFLDNKFLLYYSHTPFNKKKREILKGSGVSILFSEGNYIDPLIESEQNTAQSVENTYDILKEYHTVKNSYLKFFSNIREILKNIHITQSFSYQELKDFIYNEVAPEVKSNLYGYLAITDIKHDINIRELPYHWAVKHLLFSLAMLESAKNKISHRISHRIDIAIAMLLLDVGFIPIIKQLQIQGESQSFEYRNPKISTIVSRLNKSILGNSFVSPMVQDIILGTREYFIRPQQSKKEENIICNYCFLLSSYLYLISDTPKHASIIPPQAVYLLLQKEEQNKIFHATTLKNFVHTLGYIPHGSYVELKNGFKAMVVDQDSEYLTEPVVHIIADESNNQYPINTIIKTHDANDFSLKRILDKEEIETFQNIRKKIIQSL